MSEPDQGWYVALGDDFEACLRPIRDGLRVASLEAILGLLKQLRREPLLGDVYLLGDVPARVIARATSAGRTVLLVYQTDYAETTLRLLLVTDPAGSRTQAMHNLGAHITRVLRVIKQHMH